ncbi:MAG: DNA translocase FtsK [Oscillospiraceae bacterium]|nr:DNA translocase FtsK [Oscillospiraceae bacterium]
MISFIVMFGVLHHLFVNDVSLDDTWPQQIVSFYDNGVTGASGGFICGLIAALLRYFLGNLLAVILSFVLLVWSVFGIMDITLQELVTALIEKIEADDGELFGRRSGGKYVRRESGSDAKSAPDGTMGSTDDTESVSFFRSVHDRFRRFKQEQLEAFENDDYFDDDDEDVEEVPVAKQKRKTPVKEPEKKQQSKPRPRPQTPEERARAARLREMMSQIDGDIEQPVAVAGPKKKTRDDSDDITVISLPPAKPDPAVRKVTAKEAAASAAQVTAEIAMGQQMQKPVYSFPPINLLKAPGRGAADGTSEMKKNSVRLNETLESFKIDAHIINVTRGPSVTRYEVELDKGVRLNKLTTVADDIALSLGVSSVRIAPVPGRISVVGIEVPNVIVTNVNLREVIDSREFTRSVSKSTFAVGKDIGGNCIVGNIAKMPHMLIAGTTGSGKSVCMNSIIISLLYKASPEDVKLIMVDPKMVELGIYNDIPHLLIPVVTDPKKAAGSLQWAVTEMMRRYKLMSDAGVRDLESFNAECEEEDGRLPQVVIIIDELADLMLVAAKEVEDSICRIAQMGRAAGMHLIIATQRPSADVITGLMKANIPSRIAFSVASAMESRIILDTQGAEKLVGKGDMLFAPIGTGKPQRVQGCFVTDAEVEAVATYVKENYKANYDAGVMDQIEKTAINTGKKGGSAPEPEASAEELDGDEMLPAAVEVILETGQASVSMLQRRLKLGYARAARIVDEMEEKGIVGPFQGSKPRSILITKEQWEAKKNGSAQMSMDDIPFDVDDSDDIL